VRERHATFPAIDPVTFRLPWPFAFRQRRCYGSHIAAVLIYVKRRQDAMSRQQAEQEPSSAANAYDRAYASCMAAKGFPDQ
jgi:hypothetical protein